MRQNEQRHGKNRDDRVDQPPGSKQTEPVGQIIHRLQQELADVAVLDVGGNLPVVLVHRRQRVHNGYEQVIRGHLRERVARHFAARRLAGVNGAPEKNRGHERDQTEHRAEQKVHAVHQGVLNPDVDDVPVFAHEARG